MDVKGAKTILSKHAGKSDICDLFMKQQGITKSKMNILWDNYLEFMLVKIFGFDLGTGNQMKYSTTKQMDELWHCHVLCTEYYQAFMELVKEVNPLVEFIHHSMLLELSEDEEKLKRRKATGVAYRKLFGKDCSWLSDPSSPEKGIASYFSPKPTKRKRIQSQVGDIDFFVTLPSNEKLSFSLDPSTRAKELIRVAAEAIDVKPDAIRLIFGRQALRNHEMTLSEYGITTGSMVELYWEQTGC